MSTNTNNLKYLINWKQVSVELSGPRITLYAKTKLQKNTRQKLSCQMLIFVDEH